jgi:hypothetical protein
MLRTTFKSIPATGPIDVVILESFLVHARNLIEFFYNGAPKRAILPKDFGGPGARDKNATMKGLHDEISQLVSHLTWDRVVIHELRPQDWSHGHLEEIHDAIQAKARATFAAIPSERHAWFTCDPFPDEFRHWTP